MFKFGKSQDPSRNNPELLAIPESEDLQFVLSKAQRNWRTSADLPFRVQDSSICFTVVVKCEMGTGIPCWTLYRTDAPGSPILWTHRSNDVLLIHNLISLEYTAASEKATAEGAATPAAVAEAEPRTVQPQQSYSGGVELNPHVARLQELGRYGSAGDAEQAASPGSASDPPGFSPPELPNESLVAASKDSGRAEAAETYLDWLEGQKTNLNASGEPIATSTALQPDTEAVSEAKLKMSREIKLTRNSIEWSLSRSDTGILTYQAFVYFFENECIRFNRGGLPFSILLFDVRRESSFASSPLSPESMREVGERLRSFKRQLDVLAHFENDEGFVFVLPHTSPEGARLCMERVKQVLVEGESLLSEMDSSSIKFSCGIASMPEDGTTPEDLLCAAREAKKAQEF